MDVLLGRQFAGESFVVHGRFRPEVEAGVRKIHVHDFAQNGHDRFEFGPIGGPIFAHVVLIVPGGDAGQLVMYGHCAAVVGAVFQVACQNLSVAGHKAGPQARQVAPFGQAVENHAALEIVAADSGTGLQQAFRRVGFVRVEL